MHACIYFVRTLTIIYVFEILFLEGDLEGVLADEKNIAFLKTVVLAKSSLGGFFFDVIALAMAYRISYNVVLWLVGMYCEQ